MTFSTSTLARMHNFTCDVDTGVSPLPSWQVGDFLQKGKPVLVGTTCVGAPIFPVRLNIFAANSAYATPAAHDAWQLAALDRAASFVVADVYDTGDTVQYTLVECAPGALPHPVLDERALENVRGMLDVSYEYGPAPFVHDSRYQKLMEASLRNLAPISGRAPAAPAAPAAPEHNEADGPAWHLAEARLGELPAYTAIPTPAALQLFQANERKQAAHPALAWSEAQANFAMLFRRRLGDVLIDRLHKQNTQPVPQSVRRDLAYNLWFDPLAYNRFEPISAAQVPTRLRELEEARTVPDEDAPFFEFEADQFVDGRTLEMAAFEGDLLAVRSQLEHCWEQVEMPFRFELSVSLQPDAREAYVNVFLPQKACLPIAALRKGDTQPQITFSELNRKYLHCASGLCVLALQMVKSCAPWLTSLSLAAWYRTEAEPKCLIALKADEQSICSWGKVRAHDAVAALKEAKARIHTDAQSDLLPVDAGFDLHDALDICLGFAAFVGNWTMPPRFTMITAETTSANLKRLTDMVAQMLAQGFAEEAVNEALAHEENYREAWLDKLPKDVRGISCENELEETLVHQLLGEGEKTQVLPRHLGQLYHLLGALYNAFEDFEQARAYIEQAVSLNPANALSLLELSIAQTRLKHFDTARDLVDKAYEVAYTPYGLAQVMKQRGYWAVKDGNYDIAYYLYSYSMALYQSEEHQRKCLIEFDYIKQQTAEKHGKVSPDINLDSPASPQEAIGYLKAHGLETGMRPRALELAQDSVEDALAGGPLPKQAQMDAYLTNLQAQAHSVEHLRNLILNVYQVRFSNFPFSDYLYKPILLADTDIVFRLDSHLGLAGDDGQGEPCLVVVPYIDPHGGLMLHVLGTIDKDTRATITVLGEGRRLRLAAGPYRDTPFSVLRAIDLPDFPVDAVATELARDYAPGEQRDATRRVRAIDELRNFENPDDVVVVLMAHGMQPEGVWATLEHIDDSGKLHARLQNEPFDNFGVHAGDVCRLRLRTNPETGQVLAFVTP